MSRRVPPRSQAWRPPRQLQRARGRAVVVSSIFSRRRRRRRPVGRLVRLADERKLGTPTPRARRVLLSLGDRSFDPKSTPMMSCEPSGMRSLETSTVSGGRRRERRCRRAAAEKLVLRRHRREIAESSRLASDVSPLDERERAQTDARLSSSALFSITLVAWWFRTGSAARPHLAPLVHGGRFRRRIRQAWRRGGTPSDSPRGRSRTGCPSAPGTCQDERDARKRIIRCRSFCTLGSSASGGSVSRGPMEAFVRDEGQVARVTVPPVRAPGRARSSWCFRASAHAGVKDSPAASDHASAKKRATEHSTTNDSTSVACRAARAAEARVERVLVQRDPRRWRRAETHAEGRLVRKVLSDSSALRGPRRGACPSSPSPAEAAAKTGTTRGAARRAGCRRGRRSHGRRTLDARPKKRPRRLRGRFGVFVAFHVARCE